MSHFTRKPVGVSDQVRHKPGCTTTEDDKKLEILGLLSRGVVQFVHTVQLICSSHMQEAGFLITRLV